MEQELPKTLHELESNISSFAHKREEPYDNSDNSSTTLQQSIDELLLMFKRANEELTLEAREEKIIKSQLEPLHKKLHELTEQQETVANAIISLSDSLEHITTAVNEIKARLSANDLSNTLNRRPQQQFNPQVNTQQYNNQPQYPTFQQLENNSEPIPQIPLDPIPPPPTNQAIPQIQPNELGKKKGFFG